MRDLSPRAVALLPALLRQLEAGPVAAETLEDWWAARPGVLRVELFRALRSLVEGGHAVALDGRRWAPAGYREPEPAPAPPTPALAPMAVRVLDAVRSRPGTLNELRARLPDMADNTLRGRLSDLGRKGLLRRDGDRWAVVS